MLGWRTVCAVERDAYAAQVLAQRQNDESLRPFPIWSDVQTFDGSPWRGIVDVVSGGFPCQDISIAGKGAGISGERYGMWSHMARIVGEVRPRYVFVENSPALVTRGLGRVLGDLAALGYDCKWTVLGAADVGAPHQRDRFWLVANSNRLRQLQPQGGLSDIGRRPGHGSEKLADPAGIRQPKPGNESNPSHCPQDRCWEAGNAIHVHGWASEPDVGREVDGLG
jgi:DNA (cytosine-5)-methyltransferase 1